MTKQQAGRLGGLSTFKKYGRCHMQAIGKMGARTTWKLYKKVPYGQTKYALLRISDNTILTILSC